MLKVADVDGIIIGLILCIESPNRTSLSIKENLLEQKPDT